MVFKLQDSEKIGDFSSLILLNQLLKYTLIVTCKWRVYTKLARLHVICVIAKHIAKLVKSTSITTDITRVYHLVRLKSEEWKYRPL